jgi:hypothetical protein
MATYKKGNTTSPLYPFPQFFAPIAAATPSPNAEIKMTATKIALQDYAATLRSMVPDLHPAGMATIRAWFAEMMDAADHDDAETFARLALLIAEKVDQELEWYAEDTATPVAPTPILTSSRNTY